MSIEANKAVARRLYDEAMNGGNLDLIEELMAADFVEHEALPGIPSTGREAARAAFEMFQASFSDFRITPHEFIAEGDKVAVRATLTGTHTGELMGIPATNKPFSIQLIDVLEIREGMVTAHWGVTDMAGLMQQLGVAAGP